MKDTHHGRLRAAALTLAAVIATSACGSGDDASESTGASVTRDLLGARAQQQEQQPRNGPSLIREVPLEELGFEFGSPDAPVRVMELSDFGCGYCRQFHLETWPALREEFVETGRVHWKIVPYVTGMFDNSLPTTRATECAMEQGASTFESFTDRVWRDQPEWKASDAPRELLRSWAAEEGLDVGAYDECLSSGRRLARIEAGERLARELGVRGTPTFFVVGYGPLQGALPLDTFRQVLLAVLERETAQD